MDRGRHEDAGQATEYFWDPQERECPKGEATAKVAVLSMVLGLRLDMVQTAVADCGLDSDGKEEVKRPGLGRDATEVECEAVEAVERCGR
jgi:hypothetical protein